MTKQIGLIGLGNMGMAMARRLTEQGCSVYAFDLADGARQTAAGFCRVATKIGDITALSMVILSLPSSREVEAVLAADDGLFQAAESSTLFIDMSSSDPRSTKQLARMAQEHGHRLVDAPVSGGPSGAAAGELIIALGGAAQDKQDAARLLNLLAKKIVDAGSVGAGHMAKLANNFLAAVNLLALGDLCKLIHDQGYEPSPAVAMINAASGRSGVTDVNYPRWIANGNFDSGFTVALMDKDVGLTADVAQGRCSDFIEVVARRWAEERARLGDGADFNRVAEV